MIIFDLILIISDINFSLNPREFWLSFASSRHVHDDSDDVDARRQMNLNWISEREVSFIFVHMSRRCWSAFGQWTVEKTVKHWEFWYAIVYDPTSNKLRSEARFVGNIVEPITTTRFLRRRHRHVSCNFRTKTSHNGLAGLPKKSVKFKPPIERHWREREKNYW